jgi:phosphohistidine phosphatase
MRLYLVRHGEALPGSPDSERPLSEQGKKDVEKVVGFFKASGLKTNTIFHSGKKRAVQTAEIFRDTLNSKAEFVTQNYLNPEDSTDHLVDDLVHREADLMIVGHLPYMAKLVSRLILGDEKKIIVQLTAGSVVILQYGQGHGWQFEGLITPELLG